MADAPKTPERARQVSVVSPRTVAASAGTPSTAPQGSRQATPLGSQVHSEATPSVKGTPAGGSARAGKPGAPGFAGSPNTATQVAAHLGALRTRTSKDEKKDPDYVSPTLRDVRDVCDAMKKHAGVANVQEVACACIRNLTCEGHLRKELLNLSAEVRVLAAMERFPEKALLQEHACGALSNIACDEDGAKSVLTLNGVARLTAVMKKNMEHFGVLAQVNAAIWNLCASTSGNNIDMGPGVVKLIVAGMKEFTDIIQLLEYGCGALSMLARTANNKVAIVEEGGADVVCEAMRLHKAKPGLQKQACAALWSLTANSSVGQGAAMRAKAFERIRGAMETHHMDAGVQENACGAIRNLTAYSAENKHKALEVRLVEQICAAMATHAGQERMQKQACGALLNLAAGEDQLAVCIAQSGGVDRVCDAVVRFRQESHAIVEFAIGCLRNLAAHGALVQEVLPDPKQGMKQVVLHISLGMSAQLESSVIQREAFEALQHMCSWARGPVHAMVSCGLEERIPAAMELHRNVAIVQERGCLLLKALVQRGGRAGHQLMMGTQGTRQIEDAMNANKDSPPVLARAADALQAIYDSRLTPEIAVAGAELWVIYAMKRHPESVDVQESCLRMLHRAADKRGGCDKISKADGVLHVLIALENHTRIEGIQVEACEILRILSRAGAEDPSIPDSRTELVDLNGAAVVIASFDANPTNAAVVSSALGLLQVLASIDDETGAAAAEVIVLENGIENTCKAMQRFPESEAIQRNGCSLLRRLSMRHRKESLKLGSFPIILAAMSNHVNKVEVQRQAIGAMIGLVGRARVVEPYKVEGGKEAQGARASPRSPAGRKAGVKFGAESPGASARSPGRGDRDTHGEPMSIQPSSVTGSKSDIQRLTSRMDTKSSHGSKRSKHSRAISGSVEDGVHWNLRTSAGPRDEDIFVQADRPKRMTGDAMVLEFARQTSPMGLEDEPPIAKDTELLKESFVREVSAGFERTISGGAGSPRSPRGGDSPRSGGGSPRSPRGEPQPQVSVDASQFSRGGGDSERDMEKSAAAAKKAVGGLVGSINRKKAIGDKGDDQMMEQAVAATRAVCRAMGAHGTAVSLQRTACIVLQRLMETGNECKNAAHQENIFKLLKFAMEFHRSQEGMQRRACEVIYSLVTNNPKRKQAAFDYGMHKLVALAVTRNRRSKGLIAAGLSGLWCMCTGKPEYQQAIVETNILRVLVTILDKWIPSPSLMERACGLLASLLMGQPAYQEQATEAGLVLRVCRVVVLHSKTETVLKRGITALWSFADDSDVSRKKVLESGVIAWANYILTRWVVSASILIQTMGLVRSLCKDDEIGLAVLRSEIPGKLFGNMQKYMKNGVVQRWTCECVRLLAVGGIQSQRVLLKAGALEKLIMVMKQFREDVALQQQAIACLGNLCFKNKSIKKKMRHKGVVDSILAGLAAHPTQTGVLTMAIWTMGNLAQNDLRSQVWMLKRGVREIVNKIILNEDFRKELALQKEGHKLIRRMEGAEQYFDMSDSDDSESEEEEEEKKEEQVHDDTFAKGILQVFVADTEKERSPRSGGDRNKSPRGGDRSSPRQGKGPDGKGGASGGPGGVSPRSGGGDSPRSGGGGDSPRSGGGDSPRMREES